MSNNEIEYRFENKYVGVDTEHDEQDVCMADKHADKDKRVESIL